MIGRFTTVDPSANEEDQESDTPYGYVANNPISRTDPDGKIWNFVIGAAIGAGTEYITQVAGNIISNGGHFTKEAFTKVDGGKIALAGVGIGTGAAKLGSLASKLVSLKLGAKVVTQAANVAGDLVSSAVGSKIQGNEISAGGLIADAAGGAAGRKVEGAIKTAAANSPAGKLLQKQADRAARVAVGGRASRVAAAATAAEKAANHGATKAAIAGGVGSGVA